MVYEVKDSDGNIMALLVEGNVNENGISFFTNFELPIQVASMSHPKGHNIKAHLHNIRQTLITSTSEVLVVKSGQLKATFYSNDKKFIESKVLKKEDIAIIISGGHSFEVIEDCQFLEIKQGPYDPTNDKTIFG